MQTGSWGYTWRDGCRCSQESGLSRGFVRTDLQAAVHLCLASWAGLYTRPASTHTLSLTQTGAWECRMCASASSSCQHCRDVSRRCGNKVAGLQRVLCAPDHFHPKTTARIENIESVCPRSVCICDTPWAESNNPTCLDSWHFRYRVKTNSNKLELKNCLPTLFANQLSVYLSVYPASICPSILVKNIY